MRTTVTIDHELLNQLKARAAAEGTTLSRVIEDLLRRAARSNESPFELITSGKGGHFTELNIDQGPSLIEHDDLVRYGRK